MTVASDDRRSDHTDDRSGCGTGLNSETNALYEWLAGRGSADAGMVMRTVYMYRGSMMADLGQAACASWDMSADAACCAGAAAEDSLASSACSRERTRLTL